MADTITLAGRQVSLTGNPVSLNDRMVSPNGLADAVFEGGGVKGIAHVGALAYAEELGVTWVRVAGTSAGAIIAALVAASYSAGEIRAIMEEIDFKQFMDAPLISRIPLIGKPINLLLKKGIFKGDFFERTMERYLAEKGIRTFKDLAFEEQDQHGDVRYRLRVVASDISRGEMLVLPEDVRDYGMDPGDLSVAKAIRMSMSIPFVFEPVVVEYSGAGGKRTKSYTVDGGLLSNYPVHLFDVAGTPRWPTFGFNLQEKEVPKPASIRGPISMGRAIFNTMFSAMDRRYIEQKNWDRTIAIPTLGVGTTDFDLTDETKSDLLKSGYGVAREFFEQKWDWEAHLKAREQGVSMKEVRESGDGGA